MEESDSSITISPGDPGESGGGAVRAAEGAVVVAGVDTGTGGVAVGAAVG